MVLASPAEPKVSVLTQPAPAALHFLTFPRHRVLLDRVGEPGVVAVAAHDELDQPCGLVLGEVQGGLMMMQSVFVQPRARRRGLARAMIALFRTEARAHGKGEAMTVWTTRTAGFEAFEALLADTGWIAQRTRVSFCEGDPEPMSQDPWFRRTPMPEAPYALAPWTSVTEAELAAIASGDLGAPPELQPFYRAEHLERHVSRVLRFEGRIVGWSLVHDLPERPDALIHSRTWCHEDHRSGARGLAAIVAAVQAQVDIRRDRKISVFDVPASNLQMLRIYHKRIQRYGSLTYESRQASLLLVPELAA